MEKCAAESRKTVYLLYTLGFCVLSGIIVFFQVINGRSFIHVVDILDQDYSVFLYLGRQLRQALGSGTLHFYDFSIGLGADLISYLNNNGLGDPLNLLSVFAIGKAAPQVYALTLFLRMYLAGIGLLMYCRSHGKEKGLCILAALSYAFSLFAITYGLQYYQTMNAAYLFPFLLLQLERLIQRKEPDVSAGIKFALLITVQACCSYYFLYMQTIMLFVYAVVDFFAIYKNDWLLFGKKVISVGMYYLLGIMVSAVVIFPAVNGFLTSARAGVGIGGRMRLLWTADELIPMAADLFVPMLTSWDQASLGISMISLLAFLTCIVSKRAKERSLAILLAFAYICPVAWSIFNGFSYPSHRWMYVVHFAIAYSTILFIEHVSDGGGQNRWLELAGCILFLVSMCMHFYTCGDKIRTLCYTGIAFLGLYLLKADKKIRLRALTLLCMGNLLINIIFLTAPYQICGQDMWKRFHTLDRVEKAASDMCMSEVTEDEWYRIDCEGSTRAESIIQNYKGCEAYYSAMNENIWSFYDMLQISPGICGAVHILIGLDERAVLRSLLSVKYFDNMETEPNGYMLPFGFEYTETISEDEWKRMSPLERQDSILNKIVLEETDASESPEDPAGSRLRELPYTIQYKNVEKQGNTIVPGENAEIRIRISEELPPAEEAELYVWLKGFQGHHSMGSQGVIVGDKFLYVDSPDLENVYSTGQTDYLVKVNADGQDITIKLPKDNPYTLEDIQIYLYSLDGLDEVVRRRKEHSLENLQYSNDAIEGDISSAGGYLFLSIPYDKFWRAYVDDVQMPIYRANVGFMAVKLIEGRHHVRLVYEPTLEKAGFAVTFLGIVILCGMLVWDKRRSHLH